MLTIGLTGGLASGKSTVSNMIKELDIPLIDADFYAREVVKPEEEAYKKIVAHFGEGILHSDETIDRKKLGAVVFNNTGERNALNSFVHPAVRKKMNDQRERYLKEGRELVVLDIPLLFESELTETVDKILLVYVDEDVQLQRLIDRDGSTKEEALSRINSQMPLKEKVPGADEVIHNNGTKKNTQDQLLQILKKWRPYFRNK
jgi:dephospho-CoA kinase